MLARMWDQIGLRCLVQTFALERVALFPSVYGGCDRPHVPVGLFRVCSSKKLRAICSKQLEWEARPCSGQTRPVVFKLLGRAPKCSRGCLRSP